ncbi:F-box only protein 21-like isoform X2 [Palaemon carinicauda]|uniref:F-box only protein 21-like isoform X2 n=1 Tax=Palaemon carinicauda TaxID=392227 RepID=UPI0035B5D39C
MEISLCDLPDEILLKILSCPQITIYDLARVAVTCSRLRNIVATQYLWRLKLKDSWPKLWDQIPYDGSAVNYQEEVLQILTLERKVQEFVSRLSHHLYHDLHLTTWVFSNIDSLVSSSRYALLYVNSALRKIIEKGPKYENMTEKYYAMKVICHVHQNVCKQEWELFMAQPPNEQPLEIGAILVARWFQPHTDISTKEVISQIDKLAEDCRCRLSELHSDHPALLVPLFSPYYTLQESQWSQMRCHQIFRCVNNVLFTQGKLCGNNGDYYNLKNSLINEVLKSKKGIPITLSIIYTAVCHRLGILLEPVNYPSHFVMSWKIPGETDYEYIDAFNRGRRLTGPELLKEIPVGLHSSRDFLSSGTSVQVFQRMIRNIMNVAQMQAHVSDHMELFCSATELMSLLSPNDRSVQELLLRIYYTLEIHYDRIVAGCRRLLKDGPSGTLEEMLSDCERILRSQSEAEKTITVTKRCKEIKFATGLIMKHKRYNYTCVIFGWDKTCRMPFDWVQRMGVDNLMYKTEQPFYNVLVCDGSHRYAAQENLEICSEPEPITHVDVGKYFHTFNGKYYIPNTELQEEYPDDESAREDILKAQGWL